MFVYSFACFFFRIFWTIFLLSAISLHYCIYIVNFWWSKTEFLKRVFYIAINLKNCLNDYKIKIKISNALFYIDESKNHYLEKIAIIKEIFLLVFVMQNKSKRAWYEKKNYRYKIMLLIFFFSLSTNLHSLFYTSEIGYSILKPNSVLRNNGSNRDANHRPLDC